MKEHASQVATAVNGHASSAATTLGKPNAATGNFRPELGDELRVQARHLGIDLEQAWLRARSECPGLLNRQPRAVAISGMGGSGIAGEYAKVLANDVSPVPIEILHTERVPRWVGPDTLFVSCSHSGETRETIEAETVARERGAEVVVIATGGRLLEHAKAQSTGHWHRLKHAGPPRAALGEAIGVVLAELSEPCALNLNPYQLERTSLVHQSSAANSEASIGPVTNLAVDKTLFVVSAEHLQPVARRLCCQVAENGKGLAFAVELPEAAHNIVAGFRAAALRADQLAVLFLESPRFSPGTQASFRALGRLLNEANYVVEDICISEGSLLEELLAGTAFVDALSLARAARLGIDAHGIEEITRLKAEQDSIVNDGSGVVSRASSLSRMRAGHAGHVSDDRGRARP